MSMLICSDCQHENEPERIYCHNCGARLDRSVLPTNERAGTEEKPEETQRRLQRLLDPRGFRAMQALKNFARLVGGAALLALVIQLARSPDFPPAPTGNTISRPLNMELDTAIREHRPSEIVYNEQTVNTFLAYSLRANKGSGFPFQFERVFVGFEEGVCRMNVERSLFGFPIYYGGNYSVAIRDGRIVATNQGGNIGRMPIHPMVMKYADPVSHGTSAVLDREQKLVAHLADIQFHPQSVSLFLKPR